MKEESDVIFTQNLIRLRKERHYNQEQLSRVSGVSSSSIRNYEKGRTSPNTIQLRLLARALGVDFNELLGGYPNNRQIQKKIDEVVKDLLIYSMEKGKRDG